MSHEPQPQAAQKDRRLHLKPEPRPEKITWTWQTLCAVSGLAGGFVCLILGGLCTALGWFNRPSMSTSFLSRLGTILLAMTIPLLALGAHYLDLTDRAEKAEKKQRAESQ